MSDATLCIVDHGHDTDGNDLNAEATSGLLCKDHRRRLDDDIAEIVALILDSMHIRDGGAPIIETSGRHQHQKKRANPPAPGDVTLMAMYDARTATGPVQPTTRGAVDTSTPETPVLRIVAACLLTLARERPLTARLPQSVLAQLDLLKRHHEWIAAQPWVIAYMQALYDTRRGLKNAVSDQINFRIATCDLPTDNGQHPAVIIRRNRALRIVLICGGPVMVRNGDDVWRCSRCDQTWITDQQKARFGVRAA